jgi:hypothetical protein
MNGVRSFLIDAPHALLVGPAEWIDAPLAELAYARALAQPVRALPWRGRRHDVLIESRRAMVGDTRRAISSSTSRWRVVSRDAAEPAGAARAARWCARPAKP